MITNWKTQENEYWGSQNSIYFTSETGQRLRNWWDWLPLEDKYVWGWGGVNIMRLFSIKIMK